VWLRHQPKPPKIKAFRKTVTTVTELTGTLSLLTAGTDALGHCQRRDRATNPRRLHYGGWASRHSKFTHSRHRRSRPLSMAWPSHEPTPPPFGQVTCHYGDWANRHPKLNDSRHLWSRSLKRKSEMDRPYSTRLASVESGVRFNFCFTPVSMRRTCTTVP
jgi:hypothetical protein